MSNQLMGTLIPLVLLIVVMYFLIIRPQKKREREVNRMRSNLHVGDEIITIGGICGKIVKTKEDSIVIQVGADKTKFEMMRWSVSKVVDSVEQKDIKKNVAPEEEEEETTKRPKRLKKVAEEPVEETVDAAEETVAEEAAEAEEAVEEKAE
ncbi:MAG: preprotein translocase subunit YajC [Firmicutes bacterium]|nr:preprotein translocase subunit YajC [Bacillota bacterium]